MSVERVENDEEGVGDVAGDGQVGGELLLERGRVLVGTFRRNVDEVENGVGCSRVAELVVPEPVQRDEKVPRQEGRQAQREKHQVDQVEFVCSKKKRRKTI